jgi:hypothetical protein
MTAHQIAEMRAQVETLSRLWTDAVRLNMSELALAYAVTIIRTEVAIELARAVWEPKK